MVSRLHALLAGQNKLPRRHTSFFFPPLCAQQCRGRLSSGCWRSGRLVQQRTSGSIPAISNVAAQVGATPPTVSGFEVAVIKQDWTSSAPFLKHRRQQRRRLRCFPLLPLHWRATARHLCTAFFATAPGASQPYTPTESILPVQVLQSTVTSARVQLRVKTPDPECVSAQAPVGVP